MPNHRAENTTCRIGLPSSPSPLTRYVSPTQCPMLLFFGLSCELFPWCLSDYAPFAAAACLPSGAWYPMLLGWGGEPPGLRVAYVLRDSGRVLHTKTMLTGHYLFFGKLIARFSRPGNTPVWVKSCTALQCVYDFVAVSDSFIGILATTCKE
jgi:hypothetical protein